MDPIEFMVQQPEAAMSQPQHFHGIQRQQHQGCPVFRVDHFPHRSSLPHPSFEHNSRPHSNNYPVPQQQPQQQQQQQQHQQQQQEQQHQEQQGQQQREQHQQQSQQSQQPAQQQQPRPQHPSLPLPHLQAQPYHQTNAHSHYDPVHSASSSWTPYQPPTAPLQWPGAFGNRLPVPDQLYFGSGPGAPAGANGPSPGSGPGPGPVQPPLIPPPQRDSWAVQLPSYRRPARFHAAVPHPNNISNNNNNSAPPVSMDGHQAGFPSQPSRGISLPSLNPNSTQSLSRPTPPTASASGELSSASVALPPVSRPPLFSAPDEFPRPPDRGAGNGAPTMTPFVPQLPRPPLFGSMEPFQRTDAAPGSSNSNAPPDSDQAMFPPHSNPAIPPVPDRRRFQNAARRLSRQINTASTQQSDYDSDDDFDQLMDDADEQALRYIEEFSVGNPQFRALTEDHVRASQILRGQMSNKRVASKKALAQLQSVDLDTLPETERTCVICYNDFGVPNPEGINEAPLRLPACKHVFGDHCIKKWFEESDSCPYCRDKVHSEPVFPPSYRAIHTMLRSSLLRSRLPPSNGALTFGDEEALARLMTQDRDAARLMAHQDRGPDGAAQRSSHTGERRSPPSEASENRRRTRARHGSFRASSSAGPLAGRPPTSHTAGGPSPPQQSPPRERVMPPGLSHWAHQFPLDPNGPLTMPMARQSVPSSQRAYFSHMNLGRPPSFFPPMESQGMTSNHMVLGSSSLNHPFNSLPYPGPSNGGPAGTASTPPSAYPGGPPQAATFSQQLPPVMALEASFTVPSTTDNGGPNAAGGEGMLQ